MAKKYVLHKEAVSRLEEIKSWTTEQWTSKQAKSYLSGMKGVFEKISKDKIRSKIWPLENSDVHYCKYKKHFIFFLVEKNRIVILTVLHVGMDISSWINEALVKNLKLPD
ncbi:MAG: type II toxin-antitoxin system RelE/ParE family toxin [Lentisphaeria bacterium]|nr:type II toxin-antitoxin system RelE/ParE family toxin [Lentisphaeria bacterium]NQZ69699.1 type II toxin-antitoxin system RelE/ParE family toxin [Lentisphaeria bacterium]